MNQKKRIISVGLIEPPHSKHDDTIYVQVKKLDGQLFAEAVSSKSFRYLDELIIKGKRATNESVMNPNFYDSVGNFVEILKKYNNAERVDRFEKEVSLYNCKAIPS